MSKVNKHGLSRNIPEDVKRAVRQRDGFGCVICATPIIDYEHVDPTFANATEHNPDKIALLCPICHRKVTGRAISKEFVQQAMLYPSAKKNGAIGHELNFIDEHPTVFLGGAQMINCDIPLHVLGEDIISFEKVDGKFMLSAKFWDSNGAQSLTIDRNEWVISSKNIWDFKIIANKIIIQEKRHKPAMTVKIEDNKRLIIENFDMLIKTKIKLKGNASTLYVNNHKLQSVGIQNSHYGIVIN